MGHAEVGTTQRYSHYREHAGAARRFAQAFEAEPDAVTEAPVE